MLDASEHVPATSPPGSLDRVGDLLPDLAAQVRSWKRGRRGDGPEASTTEEPATPAQVELGLEGESEPARAVPALLEYELARRGLFFLEPKRQADNLQETEDLVGAMIMETPRGQLSVFELELMAWIMGRWDEHGDGKVRFTLRDCARDFGVSWGGSRAIFLIEALDRLHGTRFKDVRFEDTPRRGRRKERDRKMDWEHLIDRVQWKDRSEVLTGPSRGQVKVTITLGSGLAERLRAKQVKKVDWATLHRRIPSELGKRLYWLLEAQKGWPLEGEEGMVVYEVTITGPLLATLGCRDTHARRFRSKLARAGAEITEADQSYRHVGVRRGKGRGVHVLRMVRRTA